MADNTYDAIVIGSGITVAGLQKNLLKKAWKDHAGKRRDIEHVKDYVNANKDPWEFPHRGGRTQQMIKDYPVLKRDYPLNEMNLDWWVNEKESPYTEVKRFDWFRGYHVGGRSLMWGRQSYRWSDIDFEANAKDGIAVDWPIRYKEIEPWYDYVEKFAGISGSKEGLAAIARRPVSAADGNELCWKRCGARIKEHYKGKRSMIIGRTANITQPIQGEPIASTEINAGWVVRLVDISAHNLPHFRPQWKQAT